MAKLPVTPFNYSGNSLSTITDDKGEVWFVAKEIADILDYKDATELTKRLDQEDRQNLLVAGFGNRGVICINESGLYQATLESTKPEAKPFKKWVTSEVLPAIRKTGKYEAPTKVVTQLDTLRQARALSETELVAARICSRFPSLSEQSQQVIYAKLINPIAGHEVIPLPLLEEKFYTATEVGVEVRQNANNIGRLANKHGLKSRDGKYGKFFLDKSAHSDKQVESFRYNAAGVAKIRELLSANDSDKEVAA